MKPIVARFFQPLPDIAQRFYKPTQPLPVGQRALWKHKAIYRVGDAQTGKWSSPVSVTVGGEKSSVEVVVTRQP